MSSTKKTAGSIADRLRMDHLDTERVPEPPLAASLDTLRAAVDEAIESPDSAPAAATDPRDNELYTFTLEHRDARGVRYPGVFKSKILNLIEQRSVGIMRARLCGALPYEALDPSTLEATSQIAYLTYALVERPKWAADLEKLKDPSVVEAIFAEVKSHADYYFRRGEYAAEG